MLCLTLSSFQPSSTISGSPSGWSLLSRSGITHMGLELAQELGITLIARAKGRHFLVYHGADTIEFDAIPDRG